MDVLHSLMLGFSVALTPTNIFYAFFGCIVGTLIGVLPGIGPLCTIALILPTTFSMNPTSAMIMMCAVYYGAQYGGSTTSILINVPGESASVMTTWTGIRWHGQGRAGVALAISGISSFVCGTLSVIALMLMAPPLAGSPFRSAPRSISPSCCWDSRLLCSSGESRS